MELSVVRALDSSLAEELTFELGLDDDRESLQRLRKGRKS